MYGEISTIKLEQALTDNPQAILIDVRTYGELRSGMIPGAIHIDLFSPGFIESIRSLDKDRTYYIICRSGNRSDSVAGAMSHMGFKNVFNVIEGMLLWNGELEFPQNEIRSKIA